MIKRTLASVCLAASMLTLAACGDDTSGSSNDSSAGMKIGLFAPLGNSFITAYVDAAEDWAEENDAEFATFDTGFDPLNQFTQVQDAIAQKKIDGIVLVALNGPALAPLVKQAEDAGIHTVAINSPLTTDFNSLDPTTVDGLDGLVLTPAARKAELVAEGIVDACEGLNPCKVAYEATLLAQPAEKAMYDGIGSILADESGIELLVRDKCMGQRDPAIGLTQDLLQAEPDINVVASADQCLLGAEVAVERAGKELGDGEGQIRFVGASGTNEGVQRVKEGAWSSTLTVLPSEEILNGLEILQKAAQGKLSSPEGIDPLDTTDLPLIMDQDAIEKSKFEGEYSA